MAEDVPSIVTVGGFTTYGREPAKFTLKNDKTSKLERLLFMMLPNE